MLLVSQSLSLPVHSPLTSLSWRTEGRREGFWGTLSGYARLWRSQLVAGGGREGGSHEKLEEPLEQPRIRGVLICHPRERLVSG